MFSKAKSDLSLVDLGNVKPKSREQELVDFSAKLPEGFFGREIDESIAKGRAAMSRTDLGDRLRSAAADLAKSLGADVLAHNILKGSGAFTAAHNAALTEVIREKIAEEQAKRTGPPMSVAMQFTKLLDGLNENSAGIGLSGAGVKSLSEQLVPHRRRTFFT